MLLLKLKGEVTNFLFILMVLILLVGVVMANVDNWSDGASAVVAFCLILIVGVSWRSLGRIGQNQRALADLFEEYPLLKGSTRDFLAKLDYYDQQTELAYHEHYLISFFETIQVVDLDEAQKLTYYFYDWKQSRGGSWREHYLEVDLINFQNPIQLHFAQIALARLHRLVKRAFPNAKADYSDNLIALYQAYQATYPELIIDLEKDRSSDVKARKEKV